MNKCIRKYSRSLSSSFLEFLSLFFLNPLSYYPPPSFIAISPHPLAVELPIGLGGYLSNQHFALPFLDHEEELLGVFSLLRPIIQHLMWLTLSKRSH